MVPTQTASQSNQSFFQNTQSLLADRQTDRHIDRMIMELGLYQQPLQYSNAANKNKCTLATGSQQQQQSTSGNIQTNE